MIVTRSDIESFKRFVPKLALAGAAVLILSAFAPSSDAAVFTAREGDAPLEFTLPAHETTMVAIPADPIASAVYDRHLIDVQTDAASGMLYVLPKTEGSAMVYVTCRSGETAPLHLTFTADAEPRTIILENQLVHYATIQLNGPRFPIDTADYFNLVIHRALHEAGLTVEMLCQELRLDMSAVEDMLQSKVFCPDELALITFHLRLDTAFMMEAHAALTLPSCSKPSTVVAEPADTLKECVVKHGYKTLNHFSEVHGFDPIAMNTISLHRRCTDSTGMKLAQALNVSLEEIRTVLVASDFDPVPKSLKLLIKKRNYTTYKEFAAAAGLTEHHIMKIAKTRTCTTTCAVKLCKALGITEDELAASILIAEPRHKHGSKLETPSKEAMEEVASTKARRKKDESDTEEECGTSTVSLKRPRRSSK